MSIDQKKGPLTADDFLELWRSAVDETYSEPLEAAGEGEGFEAYTQLFAQFERVSKAVERTFQSLFIRPHSSATDFQATGGGRAQVRLWISRSGLIEQPFVLPKGTMVEELATDWGENGGVEVLTGRRYVLEETCAIAPGDTGPMRVGASAERFGVGYMNPLPGTIKFIVQPGSLFVNDGATVEDRPLTTYETAPLLPSHALVSAANEADVFIPAHVGQTLFFSSGSNAGKFARIIDYLPADLSDPSNPVGGRVRLAYTVFLEAKSGHFSSDKFYSGEPVTLYNIGGDVIGNGIFLAAHIVGKTLPSSRCRVLFDLISLKAGETIYSVVGDQSGEYAEPDTINIPDFIDEVGTASWQIIDFATGFQATVTNNESPVFGFSPMLDTLGEERGVARASGESDSSYASRIYSVRDVVTPNAIRRAANRALVEQEVTGCYREVGSSKFTGFYFDHDAYDYDFTVRPADRFKLVLDEIEMRGFFLMGVPSFGYGEFGFPYDGKESEPGADPFPFTNAYDTEPSSEFARAYDGFPLYEASIYSPVWRALSDVVAGGVGFDLYREDIGCTP